MKKYIIKISFLLVAAFMAVYTIVCPSMGISEQQHLEIAGQQSTNAAVTISGITIHRPYIANGNDENVIVGDIDDLSFITDKTDLPYSFPVYVNEYPVVQAPLYTIDQLLIDNLTEKLQKFLRVLYEKNDVSDYVIKHNPDIVAHQVAYNTGATRIASGADHISILTNEFGIIDDILNNNLPSNKLVQGVLKYMSIKKPKISLVRDYNSINGDISSYEYTITETTDNYFEDLLNKNFSYVWVRYALDSKKAVLLVRDIDNSKIHSNENVIPFEDARNYIQTAFNVANADSINAEIYYDSDVEIGYYVPCYKFYIKDETYGNTSDRSAYGNTSDGTAYEIVSIPMVSSISPITSPDGRNAFGESSSVGESNGSGCSAANYGFLAFAILGIVPLVLRRRSRG